MPTVRLKRRYEPKIRGLRYNGENFSEAIDFYFKDRFAVIEYNPKNKMIIAERAISNVEDEDVFLSVGGWIIEEDGHKYILTANTFNDRFVQEPPPDHKMVDVRTGREILFNEYKTEKG